MTISRYFSAPDKLKENTRNTIKALVEAHDFNPNALAKSLITRKSGLIGVVIPDIRNPFFSQLYYRLETILEPIGYSLMLCNSKEDAQKENEYLQLLFSRQVEGIIIIPVERENVEWLMRRKKKFVLVERIMDFTDANTVSCDHYRGAYLAVEHLVKLGHRNIAILCGNTDIKPYHDRFKAYCDVLAASGIQLNNDLICTSAINIESAEKAFLDLISRKQDVTAVFSCNNLMSLGTINAIYESQLTIPNDISFAAFDELPGIEFLVPSMTCVQQDTVKLAQTAVDLLLDQILHDEQTAKHIEIPVTLKQGI